jgi:SP family sugar:H+ symporter-like MFS transporter
VTGTQPRAGQIVFIAVAAALGGFLFGFDTAVVNGAVEETFTTSSFATGFAVAAALLGSAVGAWFAGQLADRIGRLRVMRLTAVVFVVSSILTGLAFSIIEFTLWRFLGGVAIAAASVIAPAYIAEISPAAYRGRLGSLQQLAITVGIFVALLSDQLLAAAAGGANEDFALGAQAWRGCSSSRPSRQVYGLMSFRIPVAAIPHQPWARRRGGRRPPRGRPVRRRSTLSDLKGTASACCRSCGSASCSRSSSSSSAST